MTQGQFETKLQLYVSEQLAKQGIRVFNSNVIKAPELGKTIEVDQILPDHGIVIEYWHSKDTRYRAKADGTLRVRRYDKDVAKTLFYMTEGYLPFWVDQAKIHVPSRHADELVETLIRLCELRRFTHKELGFKGFDLVS
jgi:hypothetical protein